MRSVVVEFLELMVWESIVCNGFQDKGHGFTALTARQKSGIAEPTISTA